MPVVKKKMPATTIATYSQNDSFYPEGAWELVGTLESGRCDWEFAVEVNQIDLGPALQFSDDMVDTSAATTLAVNRQIVTGFHKPGGLTTLGANNKDKRYFRTGYLGKTVGGADGHSSARVGIATWELYFK